jgi:nicotinate-nucleotide adenylyltransferase
MENLNPKTTPELNLQASLWRGTKIGLYGGTFNPIHQGHIDVCLMALKKLDLDFIFLLVSPGNPLKENEGLPALKTRIEDAKSAINHPRIIVTGIEETLGTIYSVDTIKALKTLAPHSHFVWLMGADNMEQFHRWKDWHEIINLTPIAVLDRPLYSIAALKSQMAGIYARYRVSERAAKKLATLRAPAWSFISKPHHPANSTDIRNNNDLGVSNVI